MEKKNQALLPSGLIDLLPPEAAREAEAVQTIIKRFESFGYERVKPPLAEFEESLFAPGPGQVVAGETFRLMDPVSQKMMALRSDTTAQIARIAATRLGHEPRPLRLAYAGEVLRIKGTQIRPEREFVKVGCELIGAHNIEADIEVAVLSLIALKDLGIGKVTIDLALPPLVNVIYAACRTDAADREVLDEALERRDRDSIRSRGGEAALLLEELTGCMGPAGDAMRKLNGIRLPDAALSYVRALTLIAEGVERAIRELELTEVNITIDPVERRGFGYHTGFAFTLFARGARGELGRGGRYDINGGGNKDGRKTETAAGFTFYMDTMRRVLPRRRQPEKREVPAVEDWAKISELQSGVRIVVRKFSDDQTGGTNG